MNPAIHRSDRFVLGEPTDVRADGFTLRISGEYVLVGDRYAPSFLEVDLDGDASAPSTSARIEVRSGVPRVVELRYSAGAGLGEVRQAHLRETQIDAFFDLVAIFSLRIDHTTRTIEMGLDERGVTAAARDTIRRARVNRKVTPEFLRDVAEVYRANFDTGPTKAVRDRFFVSARMASEYVARARRAGFLGPTVPGKKGV